MDDIRGLVGRRIRALRNKLGFTQEQLCEYADISQNYLSMLENGRKNCSIDTIQKIATALHTKPQYFLIDTLKSRPCKALGFEVKIHAIVSKLSRSEQKFLLLVLKSFTRMGKKHK